MNSNHKNTQNFNSPYEYEDDFSSSWLITYSDMITIILCFFIVFFTISAEEASLLKSISENLTKEVASLSEEKAALKEENKSLKDLIFSPSEEDSSGNFLEFLEENNLKDSVYIIEDNKGLIIRFKDGVLFPSGRSDISQEGYEILSEIAESLRDLENLIVIEGFTDNIPINTSEYPSNWELSTDRAIRVAKFFIENIGIKEDRISVSGYGEQRPIDTNDTKEGRSNNRRIEITILD